MNSCEPILAIARTLKSPADGGRRHHELRRRLLTLPCELHRLRGGRDTPTRGNDQTNIAVNGCRALILDIHREFLLAPATERNHCNVRSDAHGKRGHNFHLRTLLAVHAIAGAELAQSYPSTIGGAVILTLARVLTTQDQTAC